MTQHLANELKQLAKSHPMLSDDKLKRRMARLERMQQFYQEKAPDAPEKQSLMFMSFVSSLLYAMTIIKMYRKLTCRLAELVEEEADNENRTDSQSR